MFTWMMNPAILKNVGIAAAALILLIGVYLSGKHSVQVKFDEYKAEVIAIGNAQEEKTKQIEARNQRINEETRNAYNNQLANLRAYYGMRYKSSGNLPKVPDTPIGINDYSPDNLPITPILASQCAETTLNLLVLQNWVRGVNNEN
jgi:hypothetical protein